MPVITTQPAHQAAAVGKSATFGVGAAVSPGTAYQWTRNGVDIAGATSATLTVPSATYTDNAAVYRVTLKNAAGTIASARATLTVTSPGIMPFLGRDAILGRTAPVGESGPGNLFGYGQQIEFAPYSLASDAGGNLLIGDMTGVHRARPTAEVVTLASTVPTDQQTAAGIARLPHNEKVAAVAVGGGGSVYLVQPDSWNPYASVLTRISPAGVVTRLTMPGIAGTNVQNFTHVAADKFDNGYFSGVAVLAENCGVIECSHPVDRVVIFRVTPTGVVSIFFIAPPGGFYARNPGLWLSPAGIAIGPDNAVYMADRRNGTILKIEQSGEYSILAGVPGAERASIDGPGSRAVFAAPGDIAVDPAGNAYVCDNLTALIRKITPEGVVSTVAGTNSQQQRAYGALPGSLPRCRGMAAAGLSTLYVIDEGGVTKVELPK